MKNVEQTLGQYLSKVKNIISCDLYRLVLANGAEYRYADFDVDVFYNGKTYLHNALLLERRYTAVDNELSVDTLSVTAWADNRDNLEGLSFFKALHNGKLDRSKLYLSRAFFGKDKSIIGVIDLFGGGVEIKKVGGLKAEFTVKASTQSLHLEFPIRKYYPQGTYTVEGDTIISSVETDKTTLVAPFIPLKEVLL